MAGFFFNSSSGRRRRFAGKLREVDIAGVVAHHTVVGNRGELYLLRKRSNFNNESRPLRGV